MRFVLFVFALSFFSPVISAKVSSYGSESCSYAKQGSHTDARYQRLLAALKNKPKPRSRQQNENEPARKGNR